MPADQDARGHLQSASLVVAVEWFCQVSQSQRRYTCCSCRCRQRERQDGTEDRAFGRAFGYSESRAGAAANVERLEQPGVCEHSVYAEMAKVPENCSSAHQRCILLKQVANVGARPWTEYPDHDYDLQAKGHVHLECWFFGTDAGGDQTPSKYQARAIGG